ncbi:relaxase/mobilization nuclease domain-containing protein [Empedobacter falsenii]|uniref:MobA/VirD2-like nuclease domain-containing protein n=1 Tax=Empedobacter falsenii TaxID=343874 RepID=A0A3R8SJJ2_9FLAO|nr:relaxase/mobilization nuclease domain-containing protein [Empedobacter falsenii]RRT86374.1 hypothetical protein EGI88_14825 [Empedobacter falsenii]RRT87421.1 hypothetical protein EGI89_14775 [Empedobacter falsenii]
MAIANIHDSGSSFAGISEYVLAQGKYAGEEKTKQPEIIEKNNIYSDNYKDIGREMTEIAKGNSKVKKPVMHYSISFDEKDKTPEKVRIEAVKSTMRDMGIKDDNHQYIIVKHNDKAHPHYHVIVNRVGLDGKALSDSYTKYRLEVAIDKAEKKLGLDNSLAEKRRFVYKDNEKNYERVIKTVRSEKDIIKEPKDKAKSLGNKKEFIQDKINEALQQKRVSNPEELKAELKNSNINYEFKVNSKGLAGGSFNYQKTSIKGINIGFKASVIEKQLKSNLEYNQTEKKNNQIAETIYKEKGAFYQTEESINKVIQQSRGIDTKSKIEELKSQEPKTEQEKQINKIQIKSFEDLEVKQQKFVLELKEYKELKSQEPKKVPLLSFNKSEIIQQNEELKRKQMQAKPPSLPKYEVLNHYESIREIELRKEQQKAILKNTYEMEKKQSLSKDQKLSNDQNQNLTEQQQRILERIKEREKEKSKDQNQEQKRNRGLRR